MSDDSIWGFQRNATIWARRANPAAFWLRLVVLVAYAAALWSRQWIDAGFLVVVGALVVVGYLAERVFPAPTTAGWATRASLGERMQAEQHPLPGTSRGQLRLLAGLGGLGTLLMVSGAILFDAPLTLVGVVLMLGAKLAYFDRLARAYAASAADPAVAAWTRGD